MEKASTSDRLASLPRNNRRSERPGRITPADALQAVSSTVAGCRQSIAIKPALVRPQAPKPT